MYGKIAIFSDDDLKLRLTNLLLQDFLLLPILTVENSKFHKPSALQIRNGSIIIVFIGKDTKKMLSYRAQALFLLHQSLYNMVRSMLCPVSWTLPSNFLNYLLTNWDPCWRNRRWASATVFRARLLQAEVEAKATFERHITKIHE